MPPTSPTDSSSILSDTRKTSVTSRDGGLCVLCGIDLVDVAYIVARKAGDSGQVDWIRGVAPSLSNFRKDDAVNLICLCPTHHRYFNKGRFVLVPSRAQRELWLEHEHQDFSMREESLARGGSDPGRSFPNLLVREFEYIPIHSGPFRIFVHNPTPYDPYIFVFDTADHHPCPLLHFHASYIALMVEAQSRLSSVTRLQTVKGDAAEMQITTLLKLYQRKPGTNFNPGPLISVPDGYDTFATELEQPNTHPTARMLPSVPGSPQLPDSIPPRSTLFALDGPDPDVPGLTPSSLTSTDLTSEAHEGDVDLYTGADMQSLEYAKEPAVTWEDLKTRPPLFGGEGAGTWRFASADQICRGEWL